jgi:hypothetical protein
MGNTITSMYNEIIQSNENSTEKDFPIQFNVKKQSSFMFKLKNKYFARIIYSNRVFVYLLKRFGFNKEDAKSFLN